jgi:hypothetical protein
MEIYNSLFGGGIEEAVGRLKDSDLLDSQTLLSALKA